MRILTAGKGGNIMENQVINYETMLKVAKSISHSKDPEEVALMTVDSIKTALDVKGCALFLFNRQTDELELAPHSD
jgi:hypothetical protein